MAKTKTTLIAESIGTGYTSRHCQRWWKARPGQARQSQNLLLDRAWSLRSRRKPSRNSIFIEGFITILHNPSPLDHLLYLYWYNNLPQFILLSLQRARLSPFHAIPCKSCPNRLTISQPLQCIACQILTHFGGRKAS